MPTCPTTPRRTRSFPNAVVFSLAAFLTLVGPLLGQASKASRPSLADQLVRQLLERCRLEPPLAKSGQDIGIGKGHLVLLVRHAGGRFEAVKLERGFGVGGEKPRLPIVVEEEEVAEEVEAAPKKEPRAPKKTKKAPAKQARKAPAKQAKKKAPKKHATEPVEAPAEKPAKKQGPGKAAKLSARPPKIVLTRDAEGLELQVAGRPAFRPGKKMNRARLAKELRQARNATADNAQKWGGRAWSPRNHLTIQPSADIPLQDLLTTWEVARQVGFLDLSLVPVQGADPLEQEQSELIAGLPGRFGWKKTRTGPDVYSGELVILANGDVSWREICPIIMHCAQVGIWQVAFIGQDGRRRWKIPMHLPVGL